MFVIGNDKERRKYGNEPNVNTLVRNMLQKTNIQTIASTPLELIILKQYSVIGVRAPSTKLIVSNDLLSLLIGINAANTIHDHSKLIVGLECDIALNNEYEPILHAKLMSHSKPMYKIEESKLLCNHSDCDNHPIDNAVQMGSTNRKRRVPMKYRDQVDFGDYLTPSSLYLPWKHQTPTKRKMKRRRITSPPLQQLAHINPSANDMTFNPLSDSFPRIISSLTSSSGLDDLLNPPLYYDTDTPLATMESYPTHHTCDINLDTLFSQIPPSPLFILPRLSPTYFPLIII